MNFFVRNPNSHNNSNAALVKKAKEAKNCCDDYSDSSRWALNKEIKNSYILKEIMGEGSFGTVRKVRSRRTTKSLLFSLKSNSNSNNSNNSSSNNNGNFYGCKTIPKSKVDDINLLKEECANLEAVRGHPHLLEFVQVFEDSKDVHIITELLEGGELYETIVELKKQRGTGSYFKDDDAAWMVRNILDGISYFHDVAGIVHRDLKASNFMFKRKVRNVVVVDSKSKSKNSNKNINNSNININSNNVRDIKIIDFGLSTKIDPVTGLVKGCLGTPYYVAPEVLTEDSYTSKCDIWSIGVIAYLILSKNLPFQGKDERETVHMLMDADNHQPTYKSARWQDLDSVEPEAINFCKSLLQTDPSKRPTAREAMSHPWIVKHCGVPPPQRQQLHNATPNMEGMMQMDSTNNEVGIVGDEESVLPLTAPLSLCLSSSLSFESSASHNDDSHSLTSASPAIKVIMESIPEMIKVEQQQQNVNKKNILQRLLFFSSGSQGTRSSKTKTSTRTRQRTTSTLIFDEE